MRVVFAREKGRGADLADRLRVDGHEVAYAPLTRTVAGEPFPDPGGFDGVLFTSVNAVARAPDGVRWPRVGAVGPATAEALRARGIRVDVEGDGGGRELAAAWGDAAGRRLMLPQARDAHPDLAAMLRGAGAEVVAVAVYATEPVADPDRAALEAADVVCLFAPSQVRAYRALGITGPRVWGHGPTTRAAMKGMDRIIEDV